MPAATASCGWRMSTLLAVHEDLAAVDRVGAEDGARHFGAAGAHQPGKAQDLALAQREADIADFRAAREVLHFEHDRRRRCRRDAGRSSDRVRPTIIEMIVSIGVVVGRHGVDVFAVAHHRHAVGDALQLVHLVRDVDDADALGLEPADDA